MSPKRPMRTRIRSGLPLILTSTDQTVDRAICIGHTLTNVRLCSLLLMELGRLLPHTAVHNKIVSFNGYPVRLCTL